MSKKYTYTEEEMQSILDDLILIRNGMIFNEQDDDPICIRIMRVIDKLQKVEDDEFKFDAKFIGDKVYIEKR